jgi:hypothetical protein
MPAEPTASSLQFTRKRYQITADLVATLSVAERRICRPNTDFIVTGQMIEKKGGGGGEKEIQSKRCVLTKQ